MLFIIYFAEFVTLPTGNAACKCPFSETQAWLIHYFTIRDQQSAIILLLCMFSIDGI